MGNRTGTIALSTIASYGFFKLPEAEIDPYTRAIIGYTGGLALLTNKDPMSRILGAGLLIGATAMAVKELLCKSGAKIINNDYAKSIYVIRENSIVEELPPNAIPDYGIEGLTIKGMNGVFKAHNGVYLKILSDGTIKPKWGMGIIVNSVLAGRMSKVWTDEQTAKGDQRWAKLYEKSV